MSMLWNSVYSPEPGKSCVTKSSCLKLILETKKSNFVLRSMIKYCIRRRHIRKKFLTWKTTGSKHDNVLYKTRIHAKVKDKTVKK